MKSLPWYILTVLSSETNVRFLFVLFFSETWKWVFLHPWLLWSEIHMLFNCNHLTEVTNFRSLTFFSYASFKCEKEKKRSLFCLMLHWYIDHFRNHQLWLWYPTKILPFVETFPMSDVLLSPAFYDFDSAFTYLVSIHHMVNYINNNKLFSCFLYSWCFGIWGLYRPEERVPS